jgi:hypothetical protein
MRLVPLTLKTPESRLPRTLILRFSPSIQPSSLSLSLSLSSAPYAANVLTQGTSDGFKKVPGPLYVPVAPSAYRPNTSRPLSCENAGIGQTATGTTYAIFPPFHQLFLSTEGSKPMCIAQSKAQ